MTNAVSTGTVPEPASGIGADKLLFLVLALGGSFIVTLAAQFVSTNIADLQGAIGATPDEASWLSTVYTMGNFAGIVCAAPLSRTFGIGPYAFANAVAFCVASTLCAGGPPIDVFILLRAFQGIAAGCFGPIAFMSVFIVLGGVRLPAGLFLLAFVLLFPTTAGPVVSGYLQEYTGWRGLFVVQAVIGAALALGALFFYPWQRPKWDSIKVDWLAVFLLSTGLALMVLVANQGTRRFWYESDIIGWATAGSIGAFAGFAFLCAYSPKPIISPKLFLDRNFGTAVTLNLVFRAGFAVTTYLIPQFLAIVQGYRPLEIANLLAWGALAQLVILPFAWGVLHLVETRLVMAVGLLLCSVATGVLLNSTALSAADQFRIPVMAFCIGQVLFLASDVIVGAMAIKPSDAATASFGFNMGTLGGTTIGVGLVSDLVTEREKFHSSLLTETISLFDYLDDSRISGLAAGFASKLANEHAANVQAVSIVANAARRQAWVLAFDDGFLIVASILVVSAVGVLVIGPHPALAKIGESA
jgi:DHA2 family multidrug resistance protein